MAAISANELNCDFSIHKYSHSYLNIKELCDNCRATIFDWVAGFVCVVNFKARVGADLSATPRGGLALMNLAFQLDINSWLRRIVVAKQVQRRLGESMGGRKKYT